MADNGNNELERTLWAAADKLPGHLEPKARSQAFHKLQARPAREIESLAPFGG